MTEIFILDSLFSYFLGTHLFGGVFLLLLFLLFLFLIFHQMVLFPFCLLLCIAGRQWDKWREKDTIVTCQKKSFSSLNSCCQKERSASSAAAVATCELKQHESKMEWKNVGGVGTSTVLQQTIQTPVSIPVLYVAVRTVAMLRPPTTRGQHCESPIWAWRSDLSPFSYAKCKTPPWPVKCNCNGSRTTLLWILVHNHV